MPEYWRHGVVERAVLEAMDQLGARRDGPHRKCGDIIGQAETDFGISRRFGYDALCSMSRPWLLHLPLIDFHGNLGSADEYHRPGDATATKARLSHCQSAGPTCSRLAGVR